PLSAVLRCPWGKFLSHRPARGAQRMRNHSRSRGKIRGKTRDAKDCAFDLLTLGKCMIRLSPPQHGRIEFAPMLEVWVGGGEYNVSYALARLGLRTGWVGGLNSSPMG